MTYPESVNVSAGDATLASHYNNLRSDALLLGKDSADSVLLGTLLERFESRLEIERLDTTKLRVPASATAPVSLLIDGYLCQAVANVDLGAGDVPSGAAAAYYIFANRTAASTTFTLSVNTVSTEAASQRRIGRFYWDGSKIVKDSVRSELAEQIVNLLYYVDPQVCGGRLTLSTGVPVPISDISSSAIVYFAPYMGNRISLYVQDYGWRLYSFSELTLDISSIASGKNIDVWIYDNAGTLTLAYTEWSNDTLRATAITRQDGVYVKSGSPSYRYLGSVRTSGAGVTCSTLLKRFCINYYNPLPLKLKVRDTTASWTYATNTIRQMRGTTTNKAEFLIAVSEYLVRATQSVEVFNTIANDKSLIYIGLDSITAGASDAFNTYLRTSAADIYSMQSVLYSGFPGIGYHYLAPLECAEVGTITFYGAPNNYLKELFMAEINVYKLTNELLNAGLKIHGVSSDGEISWVMPPSEAQLLTATNVFSVHDPAPDSKSILREEYNKVGVTSNEMIFALWKKIMQNDPADADALQSLIDQVNSTLV